MLRDLMPLILVFLFCIGAVIAVHAFTLWQRRRTKAAWIAPISVQEEGEIQRLAHALRNRHLLKSIMLDPDPVMPLGSPNETRVGGVCVLGRNEAWPCGVSGKPMAGLMQVNLMQVPRIPPELAGLAFVSIFADDDANEYHVRSYTTLDDLVPVTPPPRRWPYPQGRPVKFVEIDDPAPWYDFEAELPEWENCRPAWRDRLTEMIHEIDGKGDERWQCKVGGWPAPVQDPILRPLSLQFGYDRITNIQLGDTGCLYIWRVQSGGAWTWETRMECY